MTAKEEAKELIDRFMPFSDYNECDVFTQRENQLKNAKQCALICVDEMENIQFKMYGQDKEFTLHYMEVKEEINKL